MANRFVVVTWAVRAAAWLALRDRREPTAVDQWHRPVLSTVDAAARAR